MAIGNETFWIIVSIPDGIAVTPKYDKRRALRFWTEEMADKYMRAMEDFDSAFHVVVKVPT